MDRLLSTIIRRRPNRSIERRRILAWLPAISLFAVLLFVSCLHTPGWETDITVPILSRTFYASDILDTVVFRVGDDSVMELYLEWQMDTIYLADQVGDIAVDDTLTNRLADFVLSPVANLAWGVAFGDLSGMTVPESLYTPVPRFSRSLPFAGRLPGVEHVELVDGVLRVEVLNRTAVELDTVRFSVPGLADIDIGPVPARSGRDVRTALAGVAFDSLVAGSARFSGASLESVWVRARDSVLVLLTIDSLRLARGRINLADPTRMDASGHSVSYLQTRHRVRLDSALVASGTVDFTVDNTMPLTVDARVTVDEVRFDTLVTLGSGQQAGFSLDLAGRGYRNTDPDSSRLTLSSLVTCRPGGAPVDLAEWQSLNVELHGRPLAAEYVAGEILDTAWSATQQETLVIDSPEELARMNFAHVWLSGTAVNAIGFTGLLEVRAVAYNPAGDSAVIEETLVVTPGTPGHPAVSTRTVDVTSMVSIRPDRIIAFGRAGIAGPGSASSSDYFCGEVIVQGPLEVQLVADTFSFGPWVVAVDSAKSPAILDDVTDGEIVVRLVNHLPVAMSGEMQVWSRSGETASVALAVPRPEIDHATGQVTRTRDSIITSTLTLSQCRVFADTFDAMVRFYVPTTDTITLMARDYLQVEHSYSRLTVKTEPK